MKLVTKTALLLVAGGALVGRGEAGNIFHRGPSGSPYSPIPQPQQAAPLAPTAAPPPATVEPPAPAMEEQSVTPVSAGNPADVAAPLPGRAIPNGVEVQNGPDRVVSQYEEAAPVLRPEAGLVKVN